MSFLGIKLGSVCINVVKNIDHIYSKSSHPRSILQFLASTIPSQQSIDVENLKVEDIIDAYRSRNHSY